MVTAEQSRQGLILLTDAAKAQAAVFVAGLRGTAAQKREQAFASIPGLIDYYAPGSATLAADFYEEERERAGARSRFAVVPVLPDRVQKIGNAVAWATQPFDNLTGAREERIARMVQEEVDRRFQLLVASEVPRPYQDTIQENRRADPDAVGWRRVASLTGCKFCRMLADRGAVYRKKTAYFAAHDNCSCTCAPVFKGGAEGPEASVMQYMAAKRRRSPKERAELRSYLNTYYPDAPG